MINSFIYTLEIVRSIGGKGVSCLKSNIQNTWNKTLNNLKNQIKIFLHRPFIVFCDCWGYYEGLRSTLELEYDILGHLLYNLVKTPQMFYLLNSNIFLYTMYL